MSDGGEGPATVTVTVTTYGQFNLLAHFPLPVCHCSLPALSQALFLAFSFSKFTPSVLSDPFHFLYLASNSLFHSLSVLSLFASMPQWDRKYIVVPGKTCACKTDMYGHAVILWL